MSWSFQIPAGPRDAFAPSVVAAIPTGQDLDLPGVKEDVAAAKDALLSLGERVKRPKIGGQASGHSLQKDEGTNWHDGISVGVYGAES